MLTPLSFSPSLPRQHSTAADAVPSGRGRRLAVVLATIGALLVGATATSAPARGTEVSRTPTTGVFIVDGRGNGHGHGLSQYGARGGAIAGLRYDQILAFYYPGTLLQGVSPVTVRVRVTGGTAGVTVAYQSGLVLRWAGHSYTVPAGSTRWRLMPSGGGLVLQRGVGTGWASVLGGLPAQADFTSSAGVVRYYRSVSVTVDYRGSVGAVRSGAGILPINRVGLDDYVRGVVPREMPASWLPAAVRAQAVAARSYARYGYEHSSGLFDLCDTTACQVYGGLAQYSNGQPNGIGEEAASNAAVAATANQILSYSRRTIFAQFSASNGGVTAASNQPYFVTKADPYDNTASADPYLGWTRTVAASTVAGYYGLRSVSEIDITGRQGGSFFGGIVTSAVVRGIAGNGAATSLSVTGVSLASALQLPYSLFRIRPQAQYHLDSVSRPSPQTIRGVGWTYDPTRDDVSTAVRTFIDVTPVATTPADLSRPDVQRAFGLASARHGFDVTISVPRGRHRICFRATSTVSSDLVQMGCQLIEVP